jgi:anthranilate phosphoribosyltransferase
VLEAFTKQLAASKHLTDEQVRQVVDLLVNESVPAVGKADFLCHLALKGETVEEIAAFATALLEKSVAVPLDPETRAGDILDVCGTGGDRMNTFNISTTVALICAAAGVAVAKHGNRAITSKAGSTDVLEALGVRIDLSPAEAARSLRERRFAFFFAPNYHPAFRQIGQARKLCAERGQRTIFNFLGPLLNPVRPSVQLVGVPRPELCEPMARVLQSLGTRRAMVVCGTVTDGNNPSQPKHLDELSTLAVSRVAEFYQERGFATSDLPVEQFPLQPATLADLLGGDREANARIIRNVLEGKDRGPKRDAVLLNAAAALFVAGRADDLSAGWDLAALVIDSGQARRKLEELTRP